MSNDNDSKRWTPEAREQQRSAIDRWKPWKTAGRPAPRTYQHDALGAILASLGPKPEISR